jgi:3'-phosphoadenosine 5'-phosphosulfate sulfotransferase (PAPS reductase)/FAD synthetase
MKPIFETERKFLEEKLGINLPTECWKTHTKIYLDFTCKQPIYVIEVVDGELRLKKDNRSHVDLINIKQKKFKELIKENSTNLANLEKKSVDFLESYILKNIKEKFVVSHSSGKDSVVLDEIFKIAKSRIDEEFDWVYNFANTSNETGDTYKFIKQNLPKEKTNILNPKVGYYQWIKNKNYFIPSVMVRNCCSTYKEGQLQNLYDTKIKTHMLLGVRASESSKRKKYTWIMDREFRLGLFGKDNIPEAWTNVAPIIEWTDEDIWLYILQKQLPINKQYEYGYPRVGCLICPYQHHYSDVLTKEYYPKMWIRWEDILDKNYISTDVETRLKWTTDEWKKGKWKNAVGKETEILSKKKTKDSIKELSELKGISEELAEKYWSNNCSKCDKKLNTDEVALNLKVFGRNIDMGKCVCGKCYQVENNMNRKQYSALIKQFRDSGCSLF